MILIKKFTLAFLIQSLLAVLLVSVAWASPNGVVIPAGFKLLQSTTGVQLYIKNYPSGTPDYVQVVNLSQGAAVMPLLGDVREQRPGQGVFGGNDPRILSQSLGQFWRNLRQRSQNAFCVTNGQFFYMKESPTRLPFPLKMDGELVSTGYARAEFADQKLMLEIWDDRAQITPLSKEALFASTAPTIIGGLTEDANKSAKHFVGRTFVGVADGNADGTFETILIFNTKSTRQADAAQVLRDFGSAQVMMLDGGGSTQLSCQGEDYISSDRLIPQALGVVGGPQKTLPNYVQRAQAGSPASGGAASTSSTVGTASLQASQASASGSQARTEAKTQSKSQANSGAKSKTKSQTKAQANSQEKSTAISGTRSSTASAQPASTTRKTGGVQQAGSASPRSTTLQTDGAQLTDVLWVPVSMMLVSAIFMTAFIRRRQTV